MPVAIAAIAGGLVGGSLAVSFGLATFATGWAIGSLIGQFLFAPDNDQVFTGPRLENTSPAVSNIIGSPIQIPYGTVRVPGSIIWSNTITEREIKDKQSSGGGSSKSSSTTITYEYYLDFAVAISEGPITGIKKIWANNKIIYDQDGAVVQEPWLSYNIHLGTEDQTPDPVMEGIIGSGQVPAYRDLAYIVFKQFKLEQYGNRAPYSLEFEVVALGSSAGEKTTVQFNPDQEGSAGSDAYTSQPIYITDDDFTGILISTPSDTTAFARIFNTQAPEGGYNSLTTPVALTNTVPTGIYVDALRASHNVVGLNRQGDLVTFHFRVVDTYDGDGNTMISVFDTNGDLLDVRDTGWHHSGSFLFYNARGFTLDRYWVELEVEAGWDRYKFCEGTSSLVEYLPGESNTYFLVSVEDAQVDVTGSLTDYRIKTRRNVEGGEYQLGCNVYNNQDKWSYRRIFWSNKEDLVAPRESMWIYEFNQDSFYDHDYDLYTAKIAVTPWIFFDIATFPATNLTPACDNTTMKYNNVAELWSVNYIFEVIDVGTWVFVAVKLDVADTEWPGSYVMYAVWTPSGQTTPTEYYQTDFVISTSSATSGVYAAVGNMDIDKSKYYFVDGNYRILAFDINTHVWTTRSYTPSSNLHVGKLAHIQGDRFYFAGDGVVSNDWDVRTEYIDLDQIASTSPSLASIVSDISDRAGYNLSELDVSDITSIYVPGYTIRDRETARKSIEDVTYPFFVDPVVSDWILEFKRRDNRSILPIPYNDLGCTTSDYEEPYALMLPDENTLPKEIDFRYLGKLNNYQVSHQRAARSSKATFAEDKGTISTEVVLTDAYAKEVAVKFLENTWINSKRLNIKLPKKYGYLEPTDIIQMYTKDNLLLNARIVEISNDYNILDVNAEIEYIEVYEGSDYTEFSAGFDSSDVQKIPIIAIMTFQAIDTFPIYDVFENEQTPDTSTYCYIYGAASAPFSSWSSGSTYLSQNDTDFSLGESYNARAAIGSVSSFSKDLTSVNNHKIMDIETTIVVDFSVDPGLSSITKEELLAGGQNVLAIQTAGGLWEVLYAQTVSNVDTSYTFSNLLRGRYGSDSAIYNHSASSGAIVVVLNNTTVKPSAMPYGIYDSTYYYKAVTTGSNMQSVASKSQYYRGRWTDTIPCDIVNISDDGTDISIDWVPISSFQAENMLWNPLLDNSNHRLEILDFDETVVRTVDDILTDTYTYASADIATDGLTLDDIINFNIYRKSNMQAYDTGKRRAVRLPDSLEKTLNACTTSSAQLLYDFTTLNGTTLEDIVGTTSSDLVLNAGAGFGEKKVGLTTYSKSTGNYILKKGTRFQTSSTTAGSNGSEFSCMFVLKVLKTYDAGASTVKMLERTTAGTYGSHNFGIYTTGGVVQYSADVPNNAPVLGNVGENILFVVTFDNDVAAHTERVYANGVLADTGSAGSFVSTWAGDFIFGDVNLDTNFKIETEIEMGAFAYWNYTLSAAEIAAIWNAFNSTGGFKV